MNESNEETIHVIKSKEPNVGDPGNSSSILHMSERFPEYHDIPLHYLTPSIKRAVVDKFMTEFKHTLYRYASAKNYATYPSEALWTKNGDKIVFTKDKWFDHINGIGPKAIHVVHYSDYEWVGKKKNKKSDSFEYKVTTNWFLFDIDIISPPICEMVTIALSKELNNLGLEHHIYYSGGKGTHILVLFKEEFPIKACKDFRRHLLNECGLAELYKDAPEPPKGKNDVEIRPYGGWCAKMPLTLHGKTGNFTGPLVIEGNRLKEFVGNPYQYFLDMEFSNRTDAVLTIFNKQEEIRKKAKEAQERLTQEINEQCAVNRQALNRKANSHEKNVLEQVKENNVLKLSRLIHEMEGCLNEARLRKDKGRQGTAMSLASYLKAKGNDEETTLKILKDWSRRLYKNEKRSIVTPLAEHLHMLPKIVDRVEAWYLPRSPLMTSNSKIKKLAALFQTNDQLYPFPLFKVALALFVYAQTKQFDTSKPFRFAIHYLREWLKMSPNTLVKAREELINMGILEELEAPIERNPHKNQEGKQGLYRLTLDVTDHQYNEETVMLNMESLKPKDVEKTLLVMVIENQEELEEVMGGEKHHRRAREFHKKYKLN